MLLIYLPKITPRSDFVFDFIFEQRFRIKYSCTTNQIAFEEHQGMKIWYADDRQTAAISIKNSGFLADDTLKKPDFLISELHGFTVLFAQKESAFGFDIFAAVFYLLSRYEEHLPFITDAFGRFPARESVAFKNNFLHVPVIDIWLEHLSLEMQKYFPDFSQASGLKKSLFTYDIDIAYKYKARGLARSTGAALKDLAKGDYKNLASRLQTLSGLKRDPWDLYDYILKCTSHVDTIFFFPVGNASKFDKHLDYQHSKIRRLIQNISNKTEIGVHPSFTSFKKLKKIKVEKERLEYICGKKITKSRQHYLRLSFPQTYLNLLAAGIREDYSLGYPEMPGFRAGTSHPFYFYDLKNEETTTLKIFPVVIMDATFEYYQQNEDIDTLYLEYLQKTLKYRGTFISIWHNDLLQKQEWQALHNLLLKTVNKD